MQVITVTQKYKDRAILSKVMPTSYWNKKRTEDITERGAVLETKSALKSAEDAQAKEAKKEKVDQWGIKA